jgi:hypothetical protein
MEPNQQAAGDQQIVFKTSMFGGFDKTQVLAYIDRCSGSCANWKTSRHSSAGA